MKRGSGSIDEVLNELQFVLSQKHTQAARVTLREANRRYRELHRYFLRVVRAADRGAFDNYRRQPKAMKRRAAAR